MNVTFACPSCEASVSVDFDDTTTSLACPQCGSRTAVPVDALADGEPVRCLVCPSTDLFVRKDFPQRLGVAVVIFGCLASSVAWYFYRVYLTFGILFAIAAIDVLLYLTVGESLTCYRCHAEYRGLRGLKRHGAFELATHERYRQQAARLQRH
jgi:DNA-directed RNA polymerase subunit RPC12/RpoP